MRWGITLQIALGLAALFGVTYLTAGRLMAPVESAQQVRAARAEANVAALRTAALWTTRRDAMRSVVTTMADTPTFKTLGGAFDRSVRGRALQRALAGALQLAGTEGQAVLLDETGQTLAEGDGPDAAVVNGADGLSSSLAAKAALQGRTAVIVQTIGRAPMMVAAAPIVKRKVIGVLVLALSLRAEHQRTLLQDLPPGVAIAIQLADQPIFGSVAQELTKRLATGPITGTLELAGILYRGERLSLANDGGAPMAVVALAELVAPGIPSATARLRFVVLLLGGAAFLVALVTVALQRRVALAPAAPAARDARPTTARVATSGDLPWGTQGPEASSSARSADTGSSPEFKLNFGSGASTPAPEPVETYEYDGAQLVDVPGGPIAASDEALGGGASSSLPIDTNYSSERASADVPYGGSVPDAFAPPIDSASYSSAAEGGYSNMIDELGPGTDLEVISEQRVPRAGDGAVSLPPSLAQGSAALSAMPEDAPVFHQTTIPAHPAPVDRPSSADLGRDRSAYEDRLGGPVYAAPEHGGPPFAASSAPAYVPPDQLGAPIYATPDHSGGPAFAAPDHSGAPLFGASDHAGAPTFAPPEPGGNFHEPTPFDAIAKAAFAAPQVVEPDPYQKTDLPTPKGPIPPEIKAAQRADAQRMAAAEPRRAYAGPPSGVSYDPNLPMPKDVPMPKAAGSRSPPPVTHRPTGALPPSPQAAGSLSGTGDGSERNPWRNPSVPRMKASSAASPGGSPTPFDESHYRSVYQEFVASKAQLGESVENLSYDGFRTKLRNSEESLLDRHGCRAVRFQVLIKDRTVSLRPQLVR